MVRKILAVLLVIVLLCSLSACGAVTIDKDGSGTITYSCNGTAFTEALSRDETALVAEILNGKTEHSDDPSCGFTEDISITIDGATFALACDGCGIVKDCATGNYISISESERSRLEELFTSRGGSFPYV